MNLSNEIHGEALRKDIPEFFPGDTLNIQIIVKEGEKERVQIFKGVVIRRRGSGIQATFTVRKVSQGIGVERIFPLHGPLIKQIEVVRRGRVRRSKLYYLRQRSGKSARIREKR